MALRCRRTPRTPRRHRRDDVETPRFFWLPQIAAFPGATVEPGATLRSQQESEWLRVWSGCAERLFGLAEPTPPRTIFLGKSLKC